MTSKTKRELELELELCDVKHELFTTSLRLLELEIHYNTSHARTIRMDMEKQSIKTANNHVIKNLVIENLGDKSTLS